MNLISEINKNLEIVKCLVYKLFTKDSIDDIPEITGVSPKSIENYDKLIIRERVRE